MDDKAILGLIEEVIIRDSQGVEKRIMAKIDTGADNSSLDIGLAEELSLGPIVKTKSIVSSHGRSLRPVVRLDVTLATKQIKADFTLYNRSHMNYKVLIGKNILKQGFLIDPSKENKER